MFRSLTFLPLKCVQKYSKVGPVQPMDDRDVPNTVDSTCAFRLSGATTSDLSNCCFFYSLVREKGNETIGLAIVITCGLCL